MLRISGELAFIIKDITFDSKKEFLDKLRDLRESLKNYAPEERKLIKPLLVIAIQQVFYTSEYELLRYKKYCLNRSSYLKSKENTTE